MAELRIVQSPVNVVFTCDRCGEESVIPYDTFCGKYGEPSDWAFLGVACPACGHNNVVDDWGFD